MVFEPFRIIQNQLKKRFESCSMQIRWKPIQDFSPDESETSFNPNRTESVKAQVDTNQIFSPNESKFGMIRIKNSVYINQAWIEVSDWIGLIFNRFSSNGNQNVYELVQDASGTNSKMAQNSSDYLGLNSNPKLLPGFLFHFYLGSKNKN